ncbi:MAG: GatB/YqeY domain-containing protein, partial [Bacilli bacterium]|nr:GatB/YqeY domain-containing protein [Bacilli bacterium]
MLIDAIKKENLLALKNKDENKRAILSVIINKYMILGYEAKAKNIELTDADLLNIMKKTIKELEEERKSYSEANREDKVKDITYQMDVVS